ARAGRELTSLLARAPSVAWREDEDGGLQEVDVAQVRPGDHLLVRPHEVVPVDAVLDSDDGVFDESSLTGESLPVERVRGDRVLPTGRAPYGWWPRRPPRTRSTSAS